MRQLATGVAGKGRGEQIERFVTAVATFPEVLDGHLERVCVGHGRTDGQRLSGRGRNFRGGCGWRVECCQTVGPDVR